MRYHVALLCLLLPAIMGAKDCKTSSLDDCADRDFTVTDELVEATLEHGAGTVSWSQTADCGCGTTSTAGLAEGQPCTTASECAPICCQCSVGNATFQARACLDPGDGNAACRFEATVCPLVENEFSPSCPESDANNSEI